LITISIVRNFTPQKRNSLKIVSESKANCSLIMIIARLHYIILHEPFIEGVFTWFLAVVVRNVYKVTDKIPKRSPSEVFSDGLKFSLASSSHVLA